MEHQAHWFVHVWIRGKYCGAYQYNSEQAAREHEQHSGGLRFLGCSYIVNQQSPKCKRMLTVMDQEP